MIRIIIADDHPLVREGLRNAFDKTKDIRVEAEAANGAELLRRVAQKRPDLVMMDVTMPGRDGLETLEDLKQRWPDLRVLMLTVHPEQEFALRALKLGASGYITKDVATAEVIKAIRTIMAGKTYLTPSLAQSLAADVYGTQSAMLHESLSTREFQVLRLLAAGKSLTDIAKELSLSLQTISTYRTRIMEKLGVKNNVELARYALQHHLD